MSPAPGGQVLEVMRGINCLLWGTGARAVGSYEGTSQGTAVDEPWAPAGLKVFASLGAWQS